LPQLGLLKLRIHRNSATHKKFETAGVNIFHFEDSKIKETWAIADGLTAALQLGVVKTESSETS